ncbi:MAG: hypothetical protein J5794_05345, partial [Lachnospiraceae bacterium]|nr:hypothetical protein [Lachnospiraceae bacterium]
MKAYRKRFILLTVSLVGSVLLIVFTALGIYLCRNHMRELETVMKEILRPFQTGGGDFLPIDSFFIPGQVSGDTRPTLPEGEQADGMPDGNALPFFPNAAANVGDLRFLTVLYQTEIDSISVLSDSTELDGSLIAEAASSVLEKSDSFGTLSEYGLLYYRDVMPFLTKIVFVENSYLTGRITGTILILAGVFLVSLTLFFFISLGLSRFAMRPIEEAMRMERQFVDDVSHDLKTPITVVLANTSIL